MSTQTRSKSTFDPCGVQEEETPKDTRQIVGQLTKDGETKNVYRLESGYFEVEGHTTESGLPYCSLGGVKADFVEAKGWTYSIAS